MSEPDAFRPSSSHSRYTRGSSQASNELPETSAYYQTTVDARRQSHSEQRFRNANTMYRTPSNTSTRSRILAERQATTSDDVDDAIARGLADRSDTVSRSRAASRTSKYGDDASDGNDAFLSSRDARRSPGSILPAAAFFAPKRPPQAALISPNLTNSKDVRAALSSTTDALIPKNDGRLPGSGLHSKTALPLAGGIEPKPITKTTAKSASQTRGTGNASSSSSSGEKGYKAHKGANRFLCGGLIMTSDDNPFPFLASMVVIVALPVLWLVFVAPYTWHHVSPAPVIIFAYVWAVSLSSMIVTAWRDPGVLPRDIDPDPPCTAGQNGESISVSDPLAIPLPRIIRVRHATDLKVKWCDTCGTYRPPRSSHCRVCDNCVENIDHHCTFLNTCIGRRNYFTFFAFLIASIILCCISIAFSALHIALLTHSTADTYSSGHETNEGKTVGQALKATPVSAVLFVLSIAVLVPLVTLLAYHVRLVCLNRSTVEQIRINTYRSYSEKPVYDEETGELQPQVRRSAARRAMARCIPFLDLGKPGRDPNPFAYSSVLRNVSASLLRPMTTESWIDRYRMSKKDLRRPNPGSSAT